MADSKIRHPRRSDQEWIAIIQECRASGLSDKAWCREHQIPTSKFYYHIKRLRAKACELPEHSAAIPLPVHQEIVRIDREHPGSLASTVTDPDADAVYHLSGSSVAVRLNYHGYEIDILNTADRRTIVNILSALQTLC